ncbi:hypothetical protein LSH36_12g19030 [Paralvinella palmiformis]|uniref:Uncharacterized protein n=1 Tax=Paralvinella palmiformis TaxID=53620 RepID=A0AAD9NI33_9ANNE|nr:hypothetical protein LSH36_12g19030 [Paralvinella palmiformis]
MDFAAESVWMANTALYLSVTSLPLLLALPLNYKATVSNTDLPTFDKNITMAEMTGDGQDMLVAVNGTTLSKQSLIDNTLDNKTHHISLFSTWEIEPSWQPKAITTNGEDAKIMVLPLGFLLAFLIGLAIKATHWWNEDIRYADGLMINVYNPYKTHRRVLMKIYSTEQPKSESPCRGDNMPTRAPIKVLPGNPSQRYLLDDLPADDDVFADNMRSLILAGGVSLGSYSKIRAPSFGNRSPTESMCSRCRQLEAMGSQLNVNDKDTNSRYYDEHILELCKLATVSSSLAMRRLQRQCSVASTRSASTVNGEPSREGAPLFISKRNRSCGKLCRQGTSTERNRYVGRKAFVDASRKSTSIKKTPHQKRLNSLTQRTASESQLGLFNGCDNSRTHLCDENDLLGIDALLKNSIQLNLDILHSLNASRSKAKLVRTYDKTSTDGRRSNELGSDPTSPNRTSRGSSSYLSSSDITSSNTTSTRTSATALVSSHSSAGSLCTNSSRRHSKKHSPHPYERHNLQRENNSKAFSVPSLKLSNKGASSTLQNEKSGIVFTIGSQNISTTENGCNIRRSMSSSVDGEWSSSGHQNMVVCRSVSLNSTLDCKQVSVGVVDEIKPSAESVRLRDYLIV